MTVKLSYNEPNRFIETDAVKGLKNFCYLAMNLDENMKYHSHAEVLQKNFSQLACILFRTKIYLALKSAAELYLAFVYSKMTYCLTA